MGYERNMKKVVFIIFLVVGGASLVHCTPKTPVISLGVAGPLTGDQAKMGNDILNGVTLAVDEWNGRGGVLGKMIRIVQGDDRHDPKEAVIVANRLVNKGVIAVIGHFNSSCSIPASRVYHDHKVVMITPASTNPKLTQQGFTDVFRICGTDDQQGKAEADFSVTVLRKTRIAILHDKTTYGQGLADYFRDNLKGRAEVVAYEAVTQGDKDFTPILTRVKAMNPEVIMFGGIYPEGGLLIRQMRQLGMNSAFISGDGVIDQEFIRIGGGATEGAFLSFGPLGPSGETAAPLTTVTGFISSYRAKYGDVGPYSIYAYDAAQMVLKAIAVSSGTDGGTLAATIHSMTYDGALGTIRFAQNGDIQEAPYIIWTVKGGKFVPFRSF